MIRRSILIALVLAGTVMGAGRTATNVRTTDTFARAGTANENVNNTLTSRISRRVNDSVLSCSTATGTAKACTQGGVIVYPRIVSADGIWGMLYNTDDVYYSATGDNDSWVKVHDFGIGTSAGPSGFNMWQSRTGRIFCIMTTNVIYYTDAKPKTLPGGDPQWTVATLTGDTQTRGIPGDMGIHQAANGTMAFGNYLNKTTADGDGYVHRCIWTSWDDGASWTRALDIKGIEIPTDGGTLAPGPSYDSATRKTTLVAATPVFTEAMVGQALMFASEKHYVVSDYISTTSVKVYGDSAAAEGGNKFRSSVQPEHMHSICKHEATGRWVVDCEYFPGGNRMNFLFISDDDARTWHYWDDPTGAAITAANFDWQKHNSPLCAITRLADGRHATSLYYGSDQNGRMEYVNVQTFARGPIFDVEQNWADNISYFYDMRNVGGVWYASDWASTVTTHFPMLYVSTDLSHWVPFYMFPAGTKGGLQYLGTLGGSMWWKTANTTANNESAVVVPPAKTSLLPALTLCPAKANIMPAAQASCEATASWAWNKDTSNAVALAATGAELALEKSLVTTGQYQGSNAYRMHLVSGQTDYIDDFARAGWDSGYLGNLLQAGHTYMALARVRGTAQNVGINFTVGASRPGRRDYDVDPTRWTTIISEPYAKPVDDTDLRLRVVVDACRLPGATGEFDLQMDAVEVFEVPGGSEWVALTQNAESLALAQAFGTDWSYAFTFRMIPSTREMGTAALTLFTVVQGANTLTVNYDPANQRWEVNDGTTTATLTVRDYNRGELIRGILRHSQSGAATSAVTLTLGGARGVQTLRTPLAGPWVGSGTITWTPGMPGWLAESTVYDYCMSDSEAAAVMAAASTALAKTLSSGSGGGPIYFP